MAKFTTFEFGVISAPLILSKRGIGIRLFYDFKSEEISVGIGRFYERDDGKGYAISKAFDDKARISLKGDEFEKLIESGAEVQDMVRELLEFVTSNEEQKKTAAASPTKISWTKK